MPLIKGKSKESMSKNIETEMKAGKPQKQSVAIAYATRRQAMKKKKASGGAVESGSHDMNMADGGAVSAKTEKRPIPDQTTDSTKMKSENANKKELYESGWTDNPTKAQAMNPGMKGTKIKHPKMVKSDVLQVRLRDEEDDLQSSAAPASPTEQPSRDMDEEDAKHRGEGPEEQTAHSTGRKVMAKGGKIEASDEDHSDPNAETDSDMHDTPSEDEGESMAMSHNEEHEEQTSGDPDMEPPHNKDQTKAYAEGGDVQPEPEAEDEHHDSIASAIMANRDRMHAEIDSGARDLDEAVRMAEGGHVNIEDNNNEEPNEYPPMNGDVLDHNMNDEFSDMEQHSNMIGDSAEDDRSDSHDMVDSIRRKMKAKWKLSEL